MGSAEIGKLIFTFRNQQVRRPSSLFHFKNQISMFARCTHLSLLPEKIKEATQVYNAEIAPAIRKQKGSKQVFWLEPVPGGDEFISLSLWEKEADIKAFENSADYPAIIGKIKAFAAKPPVQKYYTVHG